MKITVPVSTIEKPLTAIDYIAELERQCRNTADVESFRSQVPATVLHDIRFRRAVARKLASIREAA